MTGRQPQPQNSSSNKILASESWALPHHGAVLWQLALPQVEERSTREARTESGKILSWVHPALSGHFALREGKAPAEPSLLPLSPGPWATGVGEQ